MKQEILEAHNFRTIPYILLYFKHNDSDSFCLFFDNFAGETILTDQSSLKIGSCEDGYPYLASDEESCAHFHFCSGGISYRMNCEEKRLYDPSTGFCG